MGRAIETGGGQGPRPSFRHRARAVGQLAHQAVFGREEHRQLTVGYLDRIGANTAGLANRPDVVGQTTGAIKRDVIIQFQDHAPTDIAEKSAEERALELLVPGHQLLGQTNGDIRLIRTNRRLGGEKVRMRDLPHLYKEAKADPENTRTFSATFTSLKLDAVSAANFSGPISKARSFGQSGFKHFMRGGMSTYAPLKDTVLAASHPQRIPAEAHGIKGAAVAVLGGLTRFGAIASAVDVAMLSKAVVDRATGRNLYRIRPLLGILATDLIHSLWVTPASGFSMRRAMGLYQSIARQERAQDMRFALEDFDAAHPTDKGLMYLKGYTQLSENMWRSVIGHWKSRPARAERRFVNAVRRANGEKRLKWKEVTPDLTYGQIQRAGMSKRRQDAYFIARDLRIAFTRAQEILDANPKLAKRIRRW